MQKTFLLGIDGLPCWMWQQLAASGVMPYSSELLKSGQLVPMRSAIPEVSSAAWASIVTGTNPGGHNVYGFTDLIDGSYTLGFTSSRTFKADPFWSRDNARRHLIVNVPQSYPAQPLNGKLVAGFVALDLAKAVYPAEMLPTLEDFSYQVDADMTLIEKSKTAFLDNLRGVLTNRWQAFQYLWSSEPWDSVMFVITGTDRLNHYLWEDFEDRSSPYHQAFLDFYHEVDDVIRQIVTVLDDSVTLGIVSDHGFGRQEYSVNVNRILADHGFLKLDPSPRPSYASISAATTAFAMDPGRVYLHRKSRYPHGTLSDDEAEAVAAELVQLFADYRLGDRPLVDRVLRGCDVYDGHFAHRGPDVVLMAADGYALSARLDLTELLESTHINGKHTYENATFFCRGESLGRLPDPFRVEDVRHVLMNEDRRAEAA